MKYVYYLEECLGNNGYTCRGIYSTKKTVFKVARSLSNDYIVTQIPFNCNIDVLMGELMHWHFPEDDGIVIATLDI